MRTVARKPKPKSSAEESIWPLVLRVQPALDLTEDQFFEFCQLNRDLRIERTAEGEWLIMPPAGGGSSNRNAEINRQIANWAKQDGTGSSTTPLVDSNCPTVHCGRPTRPGCPGSGWRSSRSSSKSGSCLCAPTSRWSYGRPPTACPPSARRWMSTSRTALASAGCSIPRGAASTSIGPALVEQLDNPATLSGEPVCPVHARTAPDLVSGRPSLGTFG